MHSLIFNKTIFSTAVSTAVLMQSVLCKPYIFTKHLSATGNVPPPPVETSGGRWQYYMIDMNMYVTGSHQPFSLETWWSEELSLSALRQKKQVV